MRIICIYMKSCAYTHTHTHIYILYIYIYIYICVCVRVCSIIISYLCVSFSYLCTYVYYRKPICVCTHASCGCVYISSYAWVYVFLCLVLSVKDAWHACQRSLVFLPGDWDWQHFWPQVAVPQDFQLLRQSQVNLLTPEALLFRECRRGSRHFSNRPRFWTSARIPPHTHT